MGLIAKILSFAGREIKADQGGNDLIQAEYFGASGEDSPPLANDYVLAVPTGRSGRAAAAGYTDTTARSSAPGEIRRYARSADGDIVSTIWQRSNGTIEVYNNSGRLVLNADGTINANGAIIDTSGNITCGQITAQSVTAPTILSNGVRLNTHTHAGGTVPPPDAGG